MLAPARATTEALGQCGAAPTRVASESIQIDQIAWKGLLRSRGLARFDLGARRWAAHPPSPAASPVISPTPAAPAIAGATASLLPAISEGAAGQFDRIARRTTRLISQFDWYCAHALTRTGASRIVALIDMWQG